jgi:chromate transporter
LNPQPTLKQLALLFLRLGTTSFGGPAAHIAMMEDEVVQRRRWLTREQFLDLVAAANLIPGPNSTEIAIHIGLLAGWRGFLVAGLCFILPATVIVTLIAWAYKEFGSLPQAAGILFAIKPVMIAVVLQALWRFGRNSLKTRFLASVGLLCVVLRALGTDELLLLLAGGIFVVGHRIAGRLKAGGKTPLTALLGLSTAPLANVTLAVGAPAAVPFSQGALFLFFLKVGSVLFGSGYVLLAFLRTDLVEQRQWLTEGQLLDAIAVGQVTPGPVFTTATFIGYFLGGLPGAGVATAGIFLPAFFFVAISGPLVPRLRRSQMAGAILDGVVVASLALMVVVTWELGYATLTDLDWVRCLVAVSLTALSSLILLRFQINSSWLMLGGALTGFVLSLGGWI